MHNKHDEPDGEHNTNFFSDTEIKLQGSQCVQWTTRDKIHHIRPSKSSSIGSTEKTIAIMDNVEGWKEEQ